MADLAKLMVKIADFVVFKIELNIEVKEVNYLLWNQAQCAVNINAAMQWKRIRVVVAYRVWRQGGNPGQIFSCLLYTSPSPRDGLLSRMPSSA